MSAEQRSAIKFCVLNGISKKETKETLEKAYKSKAMKETAVYTWYERFKDGHEDVTDQPQSGRSTSITFRHLAAMKDLLDMGRCTNI